MARRTKNRTVSTAPIARARLPAGLLATAVLGTAWAYAAVRGFEFVSFDDYEYVRDNLQLRRSFPDLVGWSLTGFHSSNWHPLTWISHGLDLAWFGQDGSGHHSVNVLLHLLNGMILFGTLRQLTGKAVHSAVIAALFLVHPLHVESVAWISQRKTLLSSLFGLLSIWSYAVYVKASARRWGWLLASLIAFACSLASKPLWVTLPALLIVLDFWPLARLKATRCILLEKVPFILLAIASSIITLIVQRSYGAMESLEAVSPVARIGNALYAYAWYAWKTVVPLKLAVMYERPPISLALGAVLLAAWGLLAWWAWCERSRHPYLLTALLWFSGTLVPVIGLVQVGDQPFADRYAYLPQIGLLLGVVFGLGSLNWHATGVRATVALVLGLLCVRTQSQVQVWADNPALLHHALSVSEQIYMPHNNLGVHYELTGDDERALHHYGRALEVRPHAHSTHTNLASLHARLGDTERGIRHGLEAIRLKSDHALAHNSLGFAYEKAGRLAESEVSYTQSLALSERPGTRINRGRIRARQNSLAPALADFERALELDPQHAEAYCNIGFVRFRMGDEDAAISAFKTATRIRPDYAEAHANWGSVLARQGNYSEAAACYTRALAADPGHEEAAKNLERLEKRRTATDE